MAAVRLQKVLDHAEVNHKALMERMQSLQTKSNVLERHFRRQEIATEKAHKELIQLSARLEVQENTIERHAHDMQTVGRMLCDLRDRMVQQQQQHYPRNYPKASSQASAARPRSRSPPPLTPDMMALSPSERQARRRVSSSALRRDALALQNL